jgi:predicted acylesterase/phospholipase RssA
MNATRSDASLLRRLTRAAGRVSDALAALFFMVYVCRVAALVNAPVLGLAFVDQVQEVVRVDLVELAGPAFPRHLASAFLMLVALCGLTLFWGHYALDNRGAGSPPGGWLLRTVRSALPFALANLPTLGAFVALRGAATGLGDQARVAEALAWAALLTGLVVAAIYYGVRRRLDADARGEGAARRLSRSRVHSGILGASLLLASAAFMGVAVNALGFGHLLGTIGVLLAACIGVLPVLTWATASPHLPRWHLLSALLLSAALFSVFDLNDNHALRVLPGQAGVSGFEDSFRAWLQHRAPVDGQREVPVIVVAAEGGGVRAAYFTAKVLAALHDRCPAFSRYLFAVSGVSGGSVGAAAFAGLLDAAPAQPGVTLPCGTPQGGQAFSQRVDSMMDDDLIAPLAASLLFTDGVQRFLPWPIPAFDRARTLEDGIERAFGSVERSGFLQRSIYAYWSAERDVPQLWMQTTSVGTGQRVLFSPVTFDDEKFAGLRTVQDLAFHRHVSIVGAAVASARFPLVTPAVTLPTEPPRRLVDGGYFENSGAATISEVLPVMRLVAAQAGIRVAPILIRIGNTPDAGAASSSGKAIATTPYVEPLGLGELGSPVRALMNARVARGDLAVRMLRRRVAESLERGQWAELHEFQIGLSDVAIPLGWLLSARARAEMGLQLQTREGKDCSVRRGCENDCSIADVIRALDRILGSPDAREPAPQAKTKPPAVAPRAPGDAVR